MQSFHLPASSATMGKGKDLSPKSDLRINADDRNGVCSALAALPQAEGFAGDWGWFDTFR